MRLPAIVVVKAPPQPHPQLAYVLDEDPNPNPSPLSPLLVKHLCDHLSQVLDENINPNPLVLIGGLRNWIRLDPEIINILLDVAVYSETDCLRGVTENVMLGHLAPIGIGECALYLNNEMLKNAIDVQLPSYTDGLDFGMTPGRSPMSGTTLYHKGLMSPNYLLSPNLHMSPTSDTQFSPYVGGMTFSPTSSPGYIPSSVGYIPSSLDIFTI
ncbi:hypothetical protein VNO78_03314 [Psophocarpus tetragonolobus]|uniref:Uncharacterized protein n=1 Tax=Psophocarpus tetragonolobus TaxID=3891 RepID=A0AAN9XVU4_PSOTE